MINRRSSLCGSFAVLLIVFSVTAAAPQHADKARRPISARSVNGDLSNGAQFAFKIAPNLPQFTFKVTPEKRQPDQWGNAQSTVRDVGVFRANSTRPFQHLTGCGWSDMEPPRAGSDWFRTEDFNFDGYKDVFLMTTWGATGNFGGCVWLYNPATGHFDYSDAFSKSSNAISFDSATKTLVTFWKLGMAGLDFRAEKYKVEHNEPVLIWSERQEWDFEKKEFHCVVRQRRGADMLTVRDEWSKTSPQWSDAQPPCHSSELFEPPPQ